MSCESTRLTSGFYSYHFLMDGKVISADQVVEHIAHQNSTPIVLFGEYHAHPGVHLAQYNLLKAMQREFGQVSLSMEQFARDKQNLIDQYLQDIDAMGEEVFVIRSNAWRNYRSDYRPLVFAQMEAGLPVIAANAPRKVVRCISRVGREGIQQIPEKYSGTAVFPWQNNESHYELSNRQEYYDSFAERLGNELPQETIERQFAAQQVWDATMADSILLSQQTYPNNALMHTVGSFHVDFGRGLADFLGQTQNEKLFTIVPVTGGWQQVQNMQNRADILLWVNPTPIAYTAEEQERYGKLHRSPKAENCKFDG